MKRLLININGILVIILTILFIFQRTYKIIPNQREKFMLFFAPIQIEHFPLDSYIECAPLRIAPTLIPEIIEVEKEPTVYRWEEIDSTKHKKKVYTDYRAVTDRSSDQYKLLKQTTTDSRTGIRVIEDKYGSLRYCVAVGQYWARNQIGLLIDFYMANGHILKCVVCDVKQDIHTMNKERKYGSAANDLIEFYIDTKALPVKDWFINEKGIALPLAYPAGDVSYAGEEFQGGIKFIIIYNEIIEFK